MLKQELLDILACPKCKGELEYAVSYTHLRAHET